MVKHEPDQVVAVRLPMLHVAVIDHYAGLGGTNRSELIRRAVSDWIMARVNEEARSPDHVAPEWAGDLMEKVELVDSATLNRLREAEEMTTLHLEMFRRIEAIARAMTTDEAPF